MLLDKEEKLKKKNPICASQTTVHPNIMGGMLISWLAKDVSPLDVMG